MKIGCYQYCPEFDAPGGGKLDYHRFLAPTGWPENLRRHLMIRL